jgi:hypothetical protein
MTCPACPHCGKECVKTAMTHLQHRCENNHQWT